MAFEMINELMDINNYRKERLIRCKAMRLTKADDFRFWDNNSSYFEIKKYRNTENDSGDFKTKSLKHIILMKSEPYEGKLIHVETLTDEYVYIYPAVSTQDVIIKYNNYPINLYKYEWDDHLSLDI